jgi:transcriptional regulator with XRE-family HTH domain
MFKINSKLIRELLIARGLTLAEFSKIAQINNVTARRLVKDGATATLKVIAVVAKFFGISGESLILGNGGKPKKEAA